MADVKVESGAADGLAFHRCTCQPVDMGSPMNELASLKLEE